VQGQIPVRRFDGHVRCVRQHSHTEPIIARNLGSQRGGVRRQVSGRTWFGGRCTGRCTGSWRGNRQRHLQWSLGHCGGCLSIGAKAILGVRQRDGRKPRRSLQRLLALIGPWRVHVFCDEAISAGRR